MSFGDIFGGLGASIGSGVGYLNTQQDRDYANQADQMATDEYRRLNPNIVAQQAQAQTQGPSAYDSMKVDSTGRGGMLDALAALKARYQAGGLDAGTRADIANMNAQAGQMAAAQRGAVANTMAQRGLGSSGASIAAQRAAGQQAANTSALGGMQALAMGENRADAAMNNYGQMSGALQNYDYSTAAKHADANDAISRFNAMNQTQNNQYNATNRQNAQQQTYQNGYAQAGGVAGGLNRQADAHRQNAKQVQGMMTGAGQSMGAGLGGAADAATGAATGGMSNLGGVAKKNDAGADWTQALS